MEAFANLAEKEEDVFGEFCESLSSELSKLDGRTFVMIWKEEIAGCLSQCGLDKSDLRLLEELGNRLGYLDTEMQLSAIDLKLTQLDTILQPLEETIHEKQRIYRCAGVFFGVTIALVLV